MKLMTLVQGSPQWHAWRAGGIGASSVAAVIQWPHTEETPRSYWMQKTGRRPPPDLSKNFFVLRGNRLEPQARRAFEDWLATKGIYDVALPICVEHDNYSFIRVSLDGLLSNNVPVELKVPAWSTYMAVVNEGRKSEPYLRYYPQVQDQLLVTGADMGYLAFYQPHGNRMVVFEVERDQPFIDRMLESQIEWWNLYLRDEAPEMMDRDYYEPATVQDQQAWVDLSGQYRVITNQIAALLGPLNQLREEQSTVKDQIQRLMKDHQLGEYAGLKVVNSVRRGAIDMNAFVADIRSIFQIHGIKTQVPDPENYRKDGTVQTRFSLTDYKGSGVASTLKVVNA